MESSRICHLRGQFWRVLRVLEDIVRRDSYQRKAARGVVRSDLSEGRLDMNHVGAMSAQENNQNRTLVWKGV